MTHAEFPSQNLSGAEQRELGEMGAIIEHCFTTMYTGKVSWEEVFANIREAGFEHCLLSTDLGSQSIPASPMGLPCLRSAYWTRVLQLKRSAGWQ